MLFYKYTAVDTKPNFYVFFNVYFYVIIYLSYINFVNKL